MRKVLFTLIIINLILLVIHTNFTFVKGYGGFGIEFVFKPFHGIWPSYGGGEEKKFEELSALKNPPWYINSSSYRQIMYFDDEGGPAAALVLFILSFMLLLLVSLANLIIVIRYLAKRNQLYNTVNARNKN